MSFAFELLDIFVGQWAAAFLPGVEEEDLVHPNPTAVPENCQHLSHVLTKFFAGQTERLLEAIKPDLQLRGLKEHRVRTFDARIRSCALLLEAVQRNQEDPAAWSARRIFQRPQRVWSQQQQAVLEAVEAGTSVVDANDVRRAGRLLQVSGGPGSGKTEVILEAAIQAAASGCKVLLLGPIGLLVTSHRQRIPPDADITVETVHSAFKVTRDKDKQYVPPGRLRHFDLIIFDEVSQIDAEVWSQLQVAFRELHALPYIVFVGDFQQLQPIHGVHQLQRDLEAQAEAGSVQQIRLQQHAAARSSDPEMLAFLQHCRTRQPSRNTLVNFFEDRVWGKDADQAVRKARLLEQRTGKTFTFLTVTNKGAAGLNRAWIEQAFPAASAMLAAGKGLPGDPAYGEEQLWFEAGMRVRLTQNLDKDRGFVNGAVGTIQRVLRKDVFILKTDANVLLLVHPIWQNKRQFMPVTYGYATTIRRAQGATLELIGIRFDRKLADHGYAYVAVSRARRRVDVYLLGSVRRTDWRPVGEDDRGLGTSELTVLSMSDSEQPESEFEEPSTDMEEPSSGDFGRSEEDPEEMDIESDTEEEGMGMWEDQSGQEREPGSHGLTAPEDADPPGGCEDTQGLFA